MKRKLRRKAVVCFCAAQMAFQGTLVSHGAWQRDGTRWQYRLEDSKETVKSSWQKDGSDWYWFDGAGMMVRETWKTGSDGKWYYLGRCGKMLKNTWVVWKNELYRINEDGSMFEGEIHLQTDSKGALH